MYTASGTSVAQKTEDQVLYFSRGLPGLEDCREFFLERLPDSDLFMLLRAARQENLALILVNPHLFFPDYRFELSAEDRAELKIDRQSARVSIYTTVTVADKQLFTNLAAPLVFNLAESVGRQLILPEAIDRLRVALTLK